MIKLLFEEGLSRGLWAKFDSRDELQEEGRFNSLNDLTDFFEENAQEEFIIIMAGQQVSLVGAEMPIKNARQIIKALPFAVEEQLANDINQNHLVYLGKQGNEARAAIVQHEFMSSLSAIPNVQTALPLSLVLPNKNDRWSIYLIGNNAIVRTDETSGFSCTATQLTLYLEHAQSGEETGTEQQIELFSLPGEDHSLLTAQLETSGYKVEIETVGSVWQLAESTDKKHPANLMVGQYKPVPTKKKKAPSVLTPVIGLAASVLIVGVFANIWQGKTNEHLAKEVRKASVAYYKSLFPGERVRSLKRDFKSKLGGETNSGPVNFTNTLGVIGKPLTDEASFKTISLQNIRFNEKRGGFEMDLTASSIAQLEGYKKALSEKGFAVEITSATNENSVIKGHLKVKQNG